KGDRGCRFTAAHPDISRWSTIYLLITRRFTLPQRGWRAIIRPGERIYRLYVQSYIRSRLCDHDCPNQGTAQHFKWESVTANYRPAQSVLLLRGQSVAPVTAAMHSRTTETTSVEGFAHLLSPKRSSSSPPR